MAAVLCKSFGTFCQALFLTLTCPCRVCGETCQDATKVLASPFTPYILTTLALHLPPTGWGIRAAIGEILKRRDGEEARCDGDMWLWVNAGLSLIHIFACFYIVTRIQDERRQMQQALSDQEDQELGKSIPTATEIISDLEGNPWQGVGEGEVAESNYQRFQENQRNSPGRTAKTTKQPSKASLPDSDIPKRPTLGDKMLYSVASATSISNTIPASKSWKERASRDVNLWTDPSSDENGDYKPGEANSLQRLKQVFCYDIVVAMYLVTTIFWCVWQSLGIAQVLLHDPHFRSRHNNNEDEQQANYNNYNYNRGDDDGNNYNDDGNGNNNANYNANNFYDYSSNQSNEFDLCDDIEYWIILSILCSFLYVMVVCVAFSCSLLFMRY